MLPAATLTGLGLGIDSQSGRTLPLLSQLTSSRYLKLQATNTHVPGFSSYALDMPDLSLLQQLTARDLQGVSGSANTQQLPAQVQVLTVEYLLEGNLAPQLYLQHLTCLEQLSLVVCHLTAACPGSLSDSAVAGAVG